MASTATTMQRESGMYHQGDGKLADIGRETYAEQCVIGYYQIRVDGRTVLYALNQHTDVRGARTYELVEPNLEAGLSAQGGIDLLGTLSLNESQELIVGSFSDVEIQDRSGSTCVNLIRIHTADGNEYEISETHFLQGLAQTLQINAYEHEERNDQQTLFLILQTEHPGQQLLLIIHPDDPSPGSDAGNVQTNMIVPGLAIVRSSLLNRVVQGLVQNDRDQIKQYQELFAAFKSKRQQMCAERSRPRSNREIVSRRVQRVFQRAFRKGPRETFEQWQVRQIRELAGAMLNNLLRNTDDAARGLREFEILKKHNRRMQRRAQINGAARMDGIRRRLAVPGSEGFQDAELADLAPSDIAALADGTVEAVLRKVRSSTAQESDQSLSLEDLSGVVDELFRLALVNETQLMPALQQIDQILYLARRSEGVDDGNWGFIQDLPAVQRTALAGIARDCIDQVTAILIQRVQDAQSIEDVWFAMTGNNDEELVTIRELGYENVLQAGIRRIGAIALESQLDLFEAMISYRGLSRYERRYSVIDSQIKRQCWLIRKEMTQRAKKRKKRQQKTPEREHPLVPEYQRLLDHFDSICIRISDFGDIEPADVRLLADGLAWNTLKGDASARRMFWNLRNTIEDRADFEKGRGASGSDVWGMLDQEISNFYFSSCWFYLSE